MPTEKRGLGGPENSIRRNASDALIFCLGVILIGCLIQILGRAKGDSLVFPGVSEILRTFFRLLLSPRTYHLILTSISHLLAALIFSSAAGILLGVLEGMSDFLRKILRPMMIMLRAMPMIVLAVIIMVLADYSRVPVIATSFALVPLISEAAGEGFRGIDGELIDVCRLNSSFSPRVLFSVYLPLMAGYLRQSYINAVGMGMKIVITTEYLVQTKNSLGKAIFTSSYFNEFAEIYAYALIMILLVVILSEIPVLMMRRMKSHC